MKKILILTATVWLGFAVQAQVGINTTTPDSTAILHIYSDNKGVLLPTLDSGTRSSLSSAPAAEGLLVYDSIDKVYYFFNRATKKWLAMNPFQTTENNMGNSGSDDVRLGAQFQNRNVVIGARDADANAKLHVKGNIKTDDTLNAENANITEKLNAKNVNVSDSTWSAKIGSASLKTNAANINMAQITKANIDTVTSAIHANTIYADKVSGSIPVGGIIMWTGTVVPPCWEIVDEMKGRFPVGVGTLDGKTYVVEGTGGAHEVVLSIGQIPAHSHTIRTGGDDEADNNTNDYLHGQNGDDRANTYTTSQSGDGQPHENRPPFYGVYFIKKTSNNCPN